MSIKKSVVIRLVCIISLAILISMFVFFQYSGMGIIFKSNFEREIEKFDIYDVTDKKAEINPDLSIQNNYGVKFFLNGSNTTVNVLEIDIESLRGVKGVENYEARVFYSSDGKFIKANSVETKIRKGKNFITLNQINVKEIYLDLFMDDTKIESITINPDYSLLELIKETILPIMVNILVLFFCFFSYDKQTIFKLKKISIVECAIGVVLLYYYNKFSVLLHRSLESYAQGLLFLIIIVLGIKLSRMMIDMETGVDNVE